MTPAEREIEAQRTQRTAAKLAESTDHDAIYVRPLRYQSDRRTLRATQLDREATHLVVEVNVELAAVDHEKADRIITAITNLLHAEGV